MLKSVSNRAATLERSHPYPVFILQGNSQFLQAGHSPTRDVQQDVGSQSPVTPARGIDNYGCSLVDSCRAVEEQLLQTGAVPFERPLEDEVNPHWGVAIAMSSILQEQHLEGIWC